MSPRETFPARKKKSLTSVRWFFNLIRVSTVNYQQLERSRMDSYSRCWQEKNSNFHMLTWLLQRLTGALKNQFNFSLQYIIFYNSIVYCITKTYNAKHPNASTSWICRVYYFEQLQFKHAKNLCPFDMA